MKFNHDEILLLIIEHFTSKDMLSKNEFRYYINKNRK